MDKLKYVKIESDDGTLSENVPIGTEAQYVDVNIAGKSNNLQNYIDNNESQINSLKTQTSSNLSDIKTNAEKINEQKIRIDNLASLDEGSTTGEAELIDGRISHNGKIYSSIGEAIRSSDEDLNIKINNYITINSSEKYFERAKLNYIDKGLLINGVLREVDYRMCYY